MIHYKSKEEIELIRNSSLLVSNTIAEIGKAIQPGVTTLELDRIGEAYILDHKGIPAFKGYRGFPNAACISVNDGVVHGIPNKKELKEGDIVSVDVGVIMNDYFGDSAYTFTIGEIAPEYMHMIKITKEALYKGEII